MIIFKKTGFSASCQLVRAVLVSRLRSSRGSDSRVKSGCSHLIRDSLTLYLGFWGVQGRAPPEKKIEN